MGNNEDREKLLEDTESYFRNVQSYNTTTITVGYATFFALLAFLHEKSPSKPLFYAALLVATSAIIFVAYEMVSNINLAIESSKSGKEGKRFFRFWACFFIPSLLLGLIGVAILVFLFLKQLFP